MAKKTKMPGVSYLPRTGVKSGVKHLETKAPIKNPSPKK